MQEKHFAQRRSFCGQLTDWWLLTTIVFMHAKGSTETAYGFRISLKRDLRLERGYS